MTAPEAGAALLREAAQVLEEMRSRAPGGRWESTGLLASRPEIVARYDDGSSEHVAEARAGTGPWIVGLAPDVAAPLVDWLRRSADAFDEGRLPADLVADAARFATVLLGR